MSTAKTMKDITKMNDADLASFINEQREAVRGFRFGVGGRDAAAVRAAKKNIARAQTELTARRSK